MNNQYDLSIVIPARSEMFLTKTVEGILASKRGKTEIIVVLDGEWSNPAIPIHPDVTVIYFPQSIGQRAATNQGVRLSHAKWIMKLDAHCKLEEGFDIKLLEDTQDNWTIIPALYNLHMFDWVCIGTNPKSGKLYLEKDQIPSGGCGNRIYQGPTPQNCPKCKGNMERELIFDCRWDKHRSDFYRFDKTMHFQYWGAFKERPEAQGDIAPSLSAQGSCFMLTREKYWELEICDEDAAGKTGWGQQGTEVACKTWLSGGQLLINKRTWYSHMFRTQGGDFGFPYPLPGSDQDKARKFSQDLWIGNKWPKAIHTLEWLLDKFKPVPDWHEPKDKTKLEKGVIYYTDNELDSTIMESCQKQLRKGIKEKHIVSVSLKPLQFGRNIVMNAQRGYLTMAKQILAGLESSGAQIIFFCEHDVLYHPSHFNFIPTDPDKIYYNTNVWRVRVEDGFALYTDNLQQLSGLCAYRETLIKHYKERVRLLKENSDNSYVRKMGFEPGTHGRPEKVDDLVAESYQSEFPNIDIRHEGNLTPSRWKKEQFRNKRFTEGWKESEVISLPGWEIDSLALFNHIVLA